MSYDASLFEYFFNAGIVVKSVMLLLLTASVMSWTFILQRRNYLKSITAAAKSFEKQFWSGEDLARLYTDGQKRKDDLSGMEAIFYAGFKEFVRFRKQSNASLETVMDNTRRAMRVAQMREADRLEQRLSFLATVGNTGPYVGLFGTVWGIMQALQGLAHAQQATIAMVAPGMAEALIATAIGLFAAIPANIFYNRFMSDISKLLNRFDAFEEEFTNILIRQSQTKTAEPTEA